MKMSAGSEDVLNLDPCVPAAVAALQIHGRESRVRAILSASDIEKGETHIVPTPAGKGQDTDDEEEKAEKEKKIEDGKADEEVGVNTRPVVGHGRESSILVNRAGLRLNDVLPTHAYQDEEESDSDDEQVPILQCTHSGACIVKVGKVGLCC